MSRKTGAGIAHKRTVFLCPVIMLAVFLLLSSSATMAQDESMADSLDTFRRRIESVEGVGKLTNPEFFFSTASLREDAFDVVVKLKVGSEPRSLTTGGLGQDIERRRWRDEVANAQVEALLPLNFANYEIDFAYENVPALSLRVNEKGLEELLANPVVEAVEPILLFQKVLAQSLPLMNAAQQQTSDSGEFTSVAIIDDGIDYLHPQLGGAAIPNGKVIGGRDIADNDPFPRDPNGAHGTAIAGIVAGTQTTFGSYIGGVAPGAKLYALKVFADGGSVATYSDLIAAVDWCITHKNDDPNAPIVAINMSLAAGKYFSVSACESAVPSLTTAVNAAVASGITVISATGNDGYCSDISLPACLGNSIAVGAVFDAPVGTVGYCIDNSSCHPSTSSNTCSVGESLATVTSAAKQATPYTNVSNLLDLFAPGDGIFTTDVAGSTGYSSGNYVFSFGGTSAATPFVSGSIAALQSRAKRNTGSYLTPAEAKLRLFQTGELITDTKGGALNPGITKPFVNLQAALNTIPVPAAPFPFQTGFEDGTFGEYWTVTGTNNHRTIVTDQYGSKSGTEAVLMDASPSGPSRNELTLTIDLEGETDVYLSFWAKEFSDEPNSPSSNPFSGGANFDGVAISTNGGTTWYEVQALREEITEEFTQFVVDLDDEISNFGLSYNDHFLIRFNHFGTYPATGDTSSDGFLIDDIIITDQKPVISVNTETINRTAVFGHNTSAFVFRVRAETNLRVDYTITQDSSWISIDPNTGSSTGESDFITASFNTETHALGNYTGTITINDPDALRQTETITVNLTVVDEDCNSNGLPDSEDISFGRSNDFNANSIPDECESVKPWTFVGGSTSRGVSPTHNSIGGTGFPGSREYASAWATSNGLWMLGGVITHDTADVDYYNDLWRYHPSSDTWFWQAGPSTANQFANLVTAVNVPHSSNHPASRQKALSWSDADDDLWLFGGLARLATAPELGNDFWRYEVGAGWAIVGGDAQAPVAGNWGSKGIATASNHPSPRMDSTTWRDANGRFWLFGGWGIDSTGTEGLLNDLWRYNPGNAMWTWIAGTSLANQSSVTGGETPLPSGRQGAGGWTNSVGQFLMFGGAGPFNTISGDYPHYSDLWRFDPATGKWTLLNSNVTNQAPTFGRMGFFESIPGARANMAVWKGNDGDYWMFGGNIEAEHPNPWSHRAELWSLDSGFFNWAWLRGCQTADVPSIYGFAGEENVYLQPGARAGAASWTDAYGNFWMYGGTAFPNPGAPGYTYADMWSIKFVEPPQPDGGHLWMFK